MCVRLAGHGVAVAATVVGVVVWAPLLGCHKPPLTCGAADLQSPRTRAKVADLYWTRNNVPALQQRGYKRAAIVEFSVEYVTGKLVVPGSTQPTFTPPAVVPAHVGLEFGGLFRKQFNYDPALYRELADELYVLFTNELTARGLKVVPAAKVSRSQAYQRLRTVEYDDGSILQEFNLIGSDAGRVKQMVTHPASGLRVVRGAGEEDIEDVELALLEELAADLSLRVHIRVGVYQGRATVERGSVVWVLTRDVVGNLTADRSLLSDTSVVGRGSFLPVQGQAHQVNSQRYIAAMQQIFPPYVSMALETCVR